MMVLDVSNPSNVALPSIEQDLDFSPENLQWVDHRLRDRPSAASCSSEDVPPTSSGRRDRLHRRRRRSVSLCSRSRCGLSELLAILIVARAIQGAAGAIIVALGASRSSMRRLSPRVRSATRRSGSSARSPVRGAAIGVILGGDPDRSTWAGSGSSSSTCRSAAARSALTRTFVRESRRRGRASSLRPARRRHHHRRRSWCSSTRSRRPRTQRLGLGPDVGSCIVSGCCSCAFLVIERRWRSR